MKNFYVKFLLAILFINTSFSYAGNDKPAYVVYNAKGKKVSYHKMEKAILKKKMIFFGELHDNSIAHWLQYELLLALQQQVGSNELVLAMEMFERDNQAIIERYLKGEIDTKTFEDSCRLWSNYKSDYKPMLEFAKSKNVAVVGSNIPRRYASLLYKKGEAALDSLSELEKSWIAPLPLVVDTSLSQYANLIKGFAHNGLNFVKAQAIKDATMAFFAWEAIKEGKVLYHLNGSYHSDYQQGILWYMEKLGAKASDMITITTVENAQVSKFNKENLGKADYIIYIPETVIKSTH